MEKTYNLTTLLADNPKLRIYDHVNKDMHFKLKLFFLNEINLNKNHSTQKQQIMK